MQGKCNCKTRTFFSQPFYHMYAADMQQPKRTCGIVNPSIITWKNLVDYLCISNFNLAKHMLYLWVILSFSTLHPIVIAEIYSNLNVCICLQDFFFCSVRAWETGPHTSLLLHCSNQFVNIPSGIGNPSWHFSSAEAVTYTEEVASKVLMYFW